MITLLADHQIVNLKKYLHPDIQCITYNSEVGPGLNQLKKADAMIVRTVTRVDEKIISGAPNLKFLGTASAGFDHIDIDLLQQNDIFFSSAQGCNARSVAEYVAVCIILWSLKRNITLDHLTVGIIGVGNTGFAVKDILETIGLKVLCYDPPRELRDQNFSSHSMDEIISSDILTFHVPLIHKGSLPTYKWLDANKIKSSNALLFINSARGGVVDELALLKAKINKNIDYILDVWENEPVFDDTIAENAFIKTPHIAGYSKQSKIKATKIVCDDLHNYFNLKVLQSELSSVLPSITPVQYNESLENILDKIHPILTFNEQFRLLIGLPIKEKRLQFNNLRSGIPLREEFNQIRIPINILEKFPLLADLGISDDTQ